MPVMVRGVLGTRNRLGKIKIVLYHKLPTSVLPLVSGKDTELIKMLFWEAHVDGVDLHLNKNLTVLQIRTGFYGCHILAMSKMVKSMIENCVVCKKKQLQLEKVPIGDKFGAKMTCAENGLGYSWVQVRPFNQG